MDLVDVVGLAKNAKKVAHQTVTNSAMENRQMFTTTIQSTAQKGVNVLGKTQLGATVLDGGKFVGKTANAGIKVVGKTQLGGAVLDGGKLVGGGALNIAGTLADTATAGVGLVGGTMLDGVTLVGKTAMMGGELLGDGINFLMAEDTGSAFFHEEFEELEGFDLDFQGDTLMPERFHDGKEKEMRPSMKVEWDEKSWSEMDGDPEGHIPAIVLDKTVSQRKLQIKEEEEAKALRAEEESDEESVESDKTDDIYFTDAELKKKEKRERKERKRLRKEKKRMSRLQKEEAEQEKLKKAQEESEKFAALGMSFNGFASVADLNINASTPDGMLGNLNGDQSETPVPSITMLGRQTSEGMDDIQKKQRTKNLWGKLRHNVTKRGVVKAFQGAVKENKDFFDVFDENDEIDNIDDPMGAATAMLENEHDNEKDKVQKLRKQLDEYEANLEKERKQVEEERKRIALEKTELESEFKFETERNAKLTKQFHDVKEDLDMELDKKNETKIQREIEELRAENEVLHEQVEKQDSTLRQLHREKAIREKREKRKQLYGADAHSRRSSGGTIQTFRSNGTHAVILDDDATVVTYVAKSRRSSNLKVMGENLEEMQDELEARQKVIEMQVNELENLQKQLKEAEDRSGVKPLKDEYLEVKKQTEEVEERTKQEKEALRVILAEKKEIAEKHAAEISRLKLEQTKKELEAAQEVEPPAQKGGLFGILWGDAPQEEVTDGDLALSKLGL